MPGGRPTKYNPEIHLVLAEAMSERGLTQAQIASFLDISTRTLERWMADNEEFCRAIKKAGEIADAGVVASLYQRAMGYSVKSEKIFLNRDGEIVRAPYIEHYPPDPTSMIYWTKNRMRDKWRDKPEEPPNTTTPPMRIHISGKPDPKDLDTEQNDNLEISQGKDA